MAPNIVCSEETESSLPATQPEIEAHFGQPKNACQSEQNRIHRRILSQNIPMESRLKFETWPYRPWFTTFQAGFGFDPVGKPNRNWIQFQIFHHYNGQMNQDVIALTETARKPSMQNSFPKSNFFAHHRNRLAVSISGPCFLGLAFALFFVTVGNAQDVSSLPAGLSYYLSLGGVAEELELVASQKSELDDLWLEIRDKVRELKRDFENAKRDAPDQELLESATNRFATGLKECLRTEEEQLEKVLLPHQMKRLRQIRAQYLNQTEQGAASLGEELGLTPRQLEEIRRLTGELAQEIKGLVGELRGSSGQDASSINKKMKELRLAYKEKVLALLTDEQKEQLDELMGTTFEFQKSKADSETDSEPPQKSRDGS